MWPDPTQVKTKPSSLKGTPANKFTIIASLCTIAVGVGLINLIPYIPHFQNKIERLKQDTIEYQENQEGRALMRDPMIMNAINRKRKEYEDMNELEMN